MFFCYFYATLSVLTDVIKLPSGQKQNSYCSKGEWRHHVTIDE